VPAALLSLLIGRWPFLVAWLVVALSDSWSHHLDGTSSTGPLEPLNLRVCADSENLIEKRLIRFVDPNALGAALRVNFLDERHGWLLLLVIA
jgi:hypothetical protein